MQIFEIKNSCISYQCLENALKMKWSPVIKICACLKDNAFEKYSQTKTGLQFEIPKCCDDEPKIKGCSEHGKNILDASKVKCANGDHSKHYNNITFNKTHILANSHFRGNVALTDSDNFCIGPTWNNDGDWKTLQVKMDLYKCPAVIPCNNRTPCLRFVLVFFSFCLIIIL